MAREYFAHDYNSRNDREMVAFIAKYKAKGLGVFWTIVEMLHEENGYLPADKITYTSIAGPLGVTPDFVQNVVNDCSTVFGLLKIDNDRFTSDRVLRNLNKRQEIREMKRKAGKASAAAKQQPLTPAQHVSTGVQQNSTKEKKVKEKKDKRNTESNGAPDLSGSNLYRKPVIPTLEKVQETFLSNGGSREMAEKFFNTHSATDWYYSGSPIKNFATLVPGYIASWNKRAPGTAPENKYENQLAEARKNYKPITQ